LFSIAANAANAGSGLTFGIWNAFYASGMAVGPALGGMKQIPCDANLALHRSTSSAYWIPNNDDSDGSSFCSCYYSFIYCEICLQDATLSE